MDLPKAILLAQYALSSKSREDISENIAQGMVVLGPTLTLDTSLKLLSVGIGTISKVGRMEELIYFAFLSVIVNYIIFMIFLPACLSLALEVSLTTFLMLSTVTFDPSRANFSFRKDPRRDFAKARCFATLVGLMACVCKPPPLVENSADCLSICSLPFF